MNGSRLNPNPSKKAPGATLFDRLPGWVAWVPRVLLAAVFLAAALPKILDPADFALAVFRYQMLPHSLVNLMALLLPWVEAVAAVALLAPLRCRDAAITLMTGMLAVFTAAIAFNLWRGVDISCGCFSVNPEVGHIGALSLLRNAGLLLLCAWAWLHERASAPIPLHTHPGSTAKA